MISRHLAAPALAAALLLPAAPAAAQQLRGTLQTTVRYLELRPIRQDTVALDETTTRPDGTLEFDGRTVFCGGTQTCVFYRPEDVEGATAATQELALTAWGFGVQGLSATALLRGRAGLGGELELPRADDGFDAVLAYLELNRTDWRLRAGRQRTLSGLGSIGFDGVDALWDARDWLRVRAFGGRSLGRGLTEPRSDALRGLDDADFLGDDEALLLGAEVGVERDGSSLRLLYQRERYVDVGELLSERASATGRTDALDPVALSGSADYDFAFGRVGKAHLTARLPLADRRLAVEATARRYLPYFELWTIWGFFSPVAYHEGELRATWTPRPGAAVWASGALRDYEETNAEQFLEPLEDRAWRATAGGRLRLGERWTLDAEGRTEGPVGAFLLSGDARLRWSASDRLALEAHALALEQIEEFRVGEGYVLGGGGSVDAELRRGARLLGGVDLYRQLDDGRPSMDDWSQLRGWMVLRIDFGRDAGSGR